MTDSPEKKDANSAETTENDSSVAVAEAESESSQLGQPTDGFGSPRQMTKRARQDALLAAFKRTCNISRSAEEVGIDRDNHYLWLQSDEEYRARYAEAQEVAGEALRDEAVRRAKEGVDRPVYQKGELVGYERQYSDRLMIYLLSLRYGNPGGGGSLNLQINVGDLEKRLDAGRERARLRAVGELGEGEGGSDDE